MHRSLLLGLTAAVLAMACGDETATIPPATSGSGAGNVTTSAAGGATAGTGGTSTTQGSGGTGATTTGAGGMMGTVDDPDAAGPYAIAQVDDTVTVPATNSDVAIHAVYPDVDSGSFPVIVFGHGFQLPPTQYYGYLDRLASHGFIALTVDFGGGFNADHPAWATDLAYGIDWAAASPETGGIADATTAGAVGHSLGGKLSVIAAANDARIKAVVGLDPVDGGSDPDASALMPLNIPTAFLGETLDQTSNFGQPCAPAAENYTTFYGPSAAPSLEVTVLGASHMSFLENPNCTVCFLCMSATADNAQILALSQAYTTAFFRRHLNGETDYDTYLTGAEAQARYVDTGLVTLQSK